MSCNSCNLPNASNNIHKKIEIADIFRGNIDKLPEMHSELSQVVNSIIKCRTSALGGHVLKCDSCGHEEYSYNSCRNRHCPKCQTLKKMKWLEARKEELLPVPYFHVVFTMPSILNPIALQNKKVIYNILFKAVSETLQDAAKTPNNLGADIGFIAILHTWGQNLIDHPHIHCVVPAGGISPSGEKWKSCRGNYFIPVKILSKLLRGKFLDFLRKAYENMELQFFGNIQNLHNKNEFQKIIDKAYSTDWVVYAKKPFAGPEQVFDYLGRYTHRVAISNNRILKLEDGKVSFKWKDYTDDNKEKIMTLDVKEFMRRFLLHVLPKGFVKIRFFGFLSNRTKNDKINHIFKILKKKRTQKEKNQETWQELFLRITGIDACICSECKKGRLIVIREIPNLNQFQDTS